MKEITVGGKTYKLPNSLTDWQQEMYVHLINWKWKHITKTPGIHKHDGELNKYDAILPTSEIENLSVVYSPIKNYIKALSTHPRYGFKLHIFFNHMVSSQAANINLFIPILLNPNANKIIRALKNKPKDFDKINTSDLNDGYQIEYWDGEAKGLLKDHTPRAGTDSDIAISYYNKEGEKCLWLIEHKLTEQEFTTCGGYRSSSNKTKDNCKNKSFSEILKNPELCHYHDKCKYAYWDITNKNKSFFANPPSEAPCPFKGGMNQLWRNQLLGLALENRGDYKHVYFSVVHHKGNTALNDSLRDYEKLISRKDKFSSFTSKDVIDTAKLIADKDIQDWVVWYRELYMVK